MKEYILILTAALLISSVGLAICQDAEGTNATTVQIIDFAFVPGTVNISAGDEVVWVNRDSAPHTVTADNGEFDSGSISMGGSFNFTFGEPGTFGYFCSIHPSMRGTVVVEPMAGDDDQNGNVSQGGAYLEDNESHTVLTDIPGFEPVVGIERVASNLTAPMVLVEPDDGTGRMFVVDQTGEIWIIAPDGGLLEEPFLNVSERMVDLSESSDERGLLSMAFHPDYNENGLFYVFYTSPLRPGGPEGWCCTNHISEFRVSDDPDVADTDSERVVMQIDKPQRNHNGGLIRFGSDGYLYIPTGDGGGANDTGLGHVPGGNAQNTSIILGKILRIDVNNQTGNMSYGIPGDNPFVGREGYLPETYAYGFRNPAFMSFDRETGEIYVGNAGQQLFEEAELVGAGENHGWNIKEGAHCFDPENRLVPPASCPDVGAMGEPLIDPIVEIGHDLGAVIIGGYVYRGSVLPQFQGRYIFGAWGTGEAASGNGALLVASRPEGDGGLWPVSLVRVMGENGTMDRLEGYIRGFGEDAEGELYIMTSRERGPANSTGEVWRIVPAD